MESITGISLEGIEPDEYGRYIIPYVSEIFEKEVTLTIPTESGVIEEWQLNLAYQFCEKEKELKEQIFESILAYYQDCWVDLKAQFGENFAHLVPSVENASQLKELLTSVGIYIGELEPQEEAIGLLFECSWEPEHGLGVLINNWEVKEVSHQDIAFTI